VRQDLNCRTAWLDGTRDSSVIYTGYAFNLLKRKGIWKEYMEEGRRRKEAKPAVIFFKRKTIY
jgi:hypothetical protein